MSVSRSSELLVTVAMAGCARGLETTPEQIEAEIRAALGDSADSQSIESYLRQRGLEFSYDRFANRYQSIIRDPRSDAHAISIYINLDAERRFADVEARDSYTMP
jgi:hypothetical protein